MRLAMFVGLGIVGAFAAGSMVALLASALSALVLPLPAAEDRVSPIDPVRATIGLSGFALGALVGIGTTIVLYRRSKPGPEDF